MSVSLVKQYYSITESEEPSIELTEIEMSKTGAESEVPFDRLKFLITAVRRGRDIDPSNLSARSSAREGDD